MSSRPSTPLAALVAGAALFVPAGGAAARQVLRIDGQRHVASGARAQLMISGRVSGRRGLAVYLDSRRCARGVVAEELRRVSRRLVVRAVRGRFAHTLTFLRSSTGSHFICAYLYHDRPGGFVTDRRASFHYVTAARRFPT